MTGPGHVVTRETLRQLSVIAERELAELLSTMRKLRERLDSTPAGRWENSVAVARLSGDVAESAEKLRTMAEGIELASRHWDGVA